MKKKIIRQVTTLILIIVASAALVAAQSGATRPRRVSPSTVDSTNAPTPTPTPNARTTSARSITNTANVGNGASTAHAFDLLKQQQYEAAAREAKQIASTDPKNGEAWKIAGFAEFNLKKYVEAAADLQRALDIQRAAKDEDANTVDALAQAYVRTDKFDLALPLLVAATTRPKQTPDAVMLYYRGLAEYRTNKQADAERSFNAAVKADPKNSASLFYLGRLAYERNETDAAIAALNRATLADPRFAEAWTLLTYAYLRRAAAANAGPKADADYLNAVRASESLLRLRTDESALALNGQALIGAKQYVKAIATLEHAAADPNAKGPTLYLLGVSYSRAKNLPKAIQTFERAAAKTPDDVNIYRELGYAYEVSKQYAKALVTYQRGLTLAPDDADFKESIERVKPFAK